jgi:spermidine synthase
MKTAHLLVATSLFAFCLVSTNPLAKVIHRERSLYSTVLVDKQGDQLCMQFSVRINQRNQTCVNTRHPKRMVFSYTRMMMAGLLVNPNPKQILVIGLGGGTLPTALKELFPAAHIDVVEIDPAVIEVAGEYFDFQEKPGLKVHAKDGRIFVKRASTDSSYDFVLLDAFNGDYIPEHLLTVEFLEEVKAITSSAGVIVANTFSISDLYHHESATYQHVFGDYYSLETPESSNRIIVATKTPLPSKEVMRANAKTLSKRLKPYSVPLIRYASQLKISDDWQRDARLLTDQYSPANILRNRNSR